MTSHPTPASRLLPAKGLLTVLVGLTLLATPACKSKKEEPAPVASATAAATSTEHQAPAATTEAPATTSDATAGGLSTKADRRNKSDKANASDTFNKGVVARKAPAPGLVWVNTKTGVYHTETSQHYGKTAEGMWMKESKAIAKGFKAVGSAKPAKTTASAAPAPSADAHDSHDHGDHEPADGEPSDEGHK
jgi:hypothetical protein